jgi:nucleotide-binding universal stress UspA family protein
MEDARHPLVVGYDGSDHSGAAVDWAAVQAAGRRAPLMVVSAISPLSGTLRLTAPWTDALKDVGLDVATEGADRARKVAPDLDVIRRAAIGGAAECLVEASKDAALLVVGTRGHGEIAGRLLGSVVLAVVARSACPVVIVRDVELPAADERHPVVVGVNGSPASVQAVTFALDVAQRSDAPLTVVGVYDTMSALGRRLDARGGLELRGGPAFESVARQGAVDAVASARALAHVISPEVEVGAVVVEGRTAVALAHVAQGAALLVIGATERSEPTGPRVGAVCHAVLHTAPCSVAVVPERWERISATPVTGTRPQTVPPAS